MLETLWILYKYYVQKKVYLTLNSIVYSVHTTVQRFGVRKIFLKFLMLTKADQKLWNIIIIQNNYCIVIYFKCNLFLWCKAEFLASLLHSSVSRDSSEIILICWFVKNVLLLSMLNTVMII